mgnify:CR=1 FL=1
MGTGYEVVIWSFSYAYAVPYADSLPLKGERLQPSDRKTRDAKRLAATDCHANVYSDRMIRNES